MFVTMLSKYEIDEIAKRMRNIKILISMQKFCNFIRFDSNSENSRQSFFEKNFRIYLSFYNKIFWTFSNRNFWSNREINFSKFEHLLKKSWMIIILLFWISFFCNIHAEWKHKKCANVKILISTKTH